jgi:hypothetical protein
MLAIPLQGSSIQVPLQSSTTTKNYRRSMIRSLSLSLSLSVTLPNIRFILETILLSTSRGTRERQLETHLRNVARTVAGIDTRGKFACCIAKSWQ